MIAAPRKKIPVVSVSPNAVKGSFRVYYPRTNFSGPLRAHLIGSDGAMLDATVLTGTSPEMRVFGEEIFAPVAVVEKFSDFGEAVDLANNTKYGLQAGVFTNDLRNAAYASDNLEYGGVIINDVPTFRVDNMPYGGVKDSGFGREGIRYAMEEMSEIRLIVLNS